MPPLVAVSIITADHRLTLDITSPRHCVDNNETLSFGTSYYLVPLLDHLSTLVQTLPFHKLAQIPTTFRGMMGVIKGLVHEDQDSSPLELLSHEII
jgi:hypothetical protein